MIGQAASYTHYSHQVAVVLASSHIAAAGSCDHAAFKLYLHSMHAMIVKLASYIVTGSKLHCHRQHGAFVQVESCIRATSKLNPRKVQAAFAPPAGGSGKQ